MFLAKVVLAELYEDTNNNKDTHSQTTSCATYGRQQETFH